MARRQHAIDIVMRGQKGRDSAKFGPAQQFDADSKARRQDISHMLGLPQGKAAFPGGDHGGRLHGGDDSQRKLALGVCACGHAACESAVTGTVDNW